MLTSLLGVVAARATSSKKGQKMWDTLEHAGVLFPPMYEPHGVKLKYDNKPVDLSPEEEEVASMFAAMKDTDYATKPVFLKNFWNDFREVRIAFVHLDLTLARPVCFHSYLHRCECTMRRCPTMTHRRSPFFPLCPLRSTDSLTCKPKAAAVSGAVRLHRHRQLPARGERYPSSILTPLRRTVFFLV
jgi:hypothetical protein